MNKIIKILSVSLLLAVLIINASNVFAVKMPVNVVYDPNNVTNDLIKTRANSVMGNFVFIVQVICIVSVVAMGIRYMFTSAEGKANVKKDLIVWCIGAFIVFTATTLIGLVLEVVRNEDYVNISPVPNNAGGSQGPDEKKEGVSEWAYESSWKPANDAGLIPDSIKNKQNKQDNITRVEFAEAVYKLTQKIGVSLGLPADDSIRVSEMVSDPENTNLSTEQENIILSLYNAEIMEGTGKDFSGNIVFEPHSLITRQDLAATLYRVLKQKPEKMDAGIQTDTCNAVDKDQVANYAKEAVYYMYNAGIIKGIGNNTIDPKGNTTCEQAIALVYRIYSGEE